MAEDLFEDSRYAEDYKKSKEPPNPVEKPKADIKTTEKIKQEKSQPPKELKPVKKELVKVEDSGLPSEIKLANGDIITLRHKTFKLTEERKQLYHVQDDYRITADGYYYVNKFANINILTPPIIIVDGVEQPNPYPLRDKKNGCLIMITVKKIAFGRAPTGNLVAIDQTLFFSPRSYLKQRLIHLCRKFPALAEMRTKLSLSVDEEKNCHFEEIITGLGVLIKNISHGEFLKELDAFENNQIFGDRKATTICERNCLRKHPAIGVSNVQLIGSGHNAYAQVTSYAFGETEKSRDKISHLSQMIEKGKIEELQDIEVIKSVDTVDTAEKVEEAEVIPTEENKKDN